MLEKTYHPAAVEETLYDRWERSGAFAAEPGAARPHFSIVIPPPNVTGSLHMGHALNNTLQDILARYERMRGKDVLWQPGTDHAGIATQMVVERQLAERQMNRQAMGRDAFVARIWDWKAESGGAITRQLRRLGASCDWSRERFTLDEGLSTAVRRVFVTLYREGLIYRDKRLVNWDPKFQTAISDLEVESRDTDGFLWHFRYPIDGEAGRFIVVATTRPETVLGDTAVAVHPDDPRYRDLVGRHVLLPLVGRKIPIVADAYADPDTGSGAVKITPAHDFNDFDVGRRHDLPLVNIFDAEARLNDAVPKAYRGLDRFEARGKLVAELEALGLVEKIEPHRHAVPHGDRSGAIIEPWLTDQWFVDARTLAEPAIRAVEEGRTRFFPEHWQNTYFEWMRDIQPWCVSRQLWWGHRIPAWYGPDGSVFVAETEDEAAIEAHARYGRPVALTRDEDVLDTWFSSALWPFSTMGWPEKTEALQAYYPTSVLVTGFDIIFFWVARMMMMGLHFMEEVPFATVYVHALVRDERGQKMSKSKGNVIDPLEIIDTYGCDALRFTLSSLAAPGRDVRLSEGRIEGSRNFVTKLWNAARYAEMNGCIFDPKFDPSGVVLTPNRWIAGALRVLGDDVRGHIAAYRFDLASQALYQFTWGTFCDWYLEITKSVLQQGEDAVAKTEVRAVTAWVIDNLLHFLHPFMPFVTEALWENLDMKRGDFLMRHPWPMLDAIAIESDATAEMEWLIRFVTAVRGVRGEMNVPPGAELPLIVKGAGPETLSRLARQGDIVRRLARLKDVAVGEAIPKGSVQAVADEATLILPLAGVIDVDKERARLEKEIRRLEDEIRRIDQKLGNDAFVAKAPPEVVAEQHGRRSDAAATFGRLQEALVRLQSF